MERSKHYVYVVTVESREKELVLYGVLPLKHLLMSLILVLTGIWTRIFSVESQYSSCRLKMRLSLDENVVKKSNISYITGSIVHGVLLLTFSLNRAFVRNRISFTWMPSNLYCYNFPYIEHRKVLYYVVWTSNKGIRNFKFRVLVDIQLISIHCCSV